MLLIFILDGPINISLVYATDIHSLDGSINISLAYATGIHT